MTLAVVGTLLGVVLGYLLGRRHSRPRPTYVSLLTQHLPPTAMVEAAYYPRQAMHWSTASDGVANREPLIFGELPHPEDSVG